VPDALAPPPPAGANFAEDCGIFFFGVQTARTLQVGHAINERPDSVTKTYLLDRDGRPVNGVSLDWLPSAFFFVYLIAMETRTGATFGDRWLRLRVIDTVTPEVSGVPLRKIISRYLVLAIGSAPILGVLFIYYALFGFFLKEVIAGSDDTTRFLLFTVPWSVWNLVILVQIVRKRDPLYDRIAGTAVVRV
jgi:hypothetical protein